MAAAVKKTAPVNDGVNFLSLDMYTSGSVLAEGDYWYEDCSLVLHSGFKADSKAPTRLGMMATLRDLSDLKAEPKKQFYSLGGKAHLSFAPDPTGKKLIPIPGGPAFQFNDQTNFAVWLKSVKDSDPTLQSVATNDLSVFDGMWAHMTNVPEPEGRKGFQSGASTGEAAAEPRKDQVIAVVTHILDNGKPWEGSGGKPKGSVTVTHTAPAPRVNGAPAVQAPAESGDESVKIAALNGLSACMEKSPSGCTKLLARVNALKHVTDNYGGEVASAAAKEFFDSEDAFNVILGELGYTLSGAQIKLL